ncbi:MAG: hypothetical protein WDA59_11065 [Methanofastidiosum sp.]
MWDIDLIEKVAEFWVFSGGDDIGFGYCAKKIEDKIREILEEREDE